MKKEKILIIGGAGFIGSHTADALSKQGKGVGSGYCIFWCHSMIFLVALKSLFFLALEVVAFKTNEKISNFFRHEFQIHVELEVALSLEVASGGRCRQYEQDKQYYFF